MAAYGRERAKGAVTSSCDHDGNVAEPSGEEIAGASFLSDMSDVVPRTMEETFILGEEYFGIYVPVGGKGVAAIECARECGFGGEFWGIGISGVRDGERSGLT